MMHLLWVANANVATAVRERRLCVKLRRVPGKEVVEQLNIKPSHSRTPDVYIKGNSILASFRTCPKVHGGEAEPLTSLRTCPASHPPTSPPPHPFLPRPTREHRSNAEERAFRHYQDDFTAFLGMLCG
ncbi:hypothetical protein E2C01_093183 [Portunus trituberculatus]|uniref:Uncharacterized protein n=1 Tax=Portunus trituberculatus TaxID=210409 RepID=A0A5B7JU63_PORTR|nr:hypothetical protein [Portunus trituberculatus]